MTQHPAVRGALIASAALTLLACAESQKEVASPSGDSASSVRCLGINSCQGQGECATAEHSCGKHTPCKGHGWLSVPNAEECAAKGGKVL